MNETTTDAALIVEHIIVRWLTETPLGRAVLVDATGTAEPDNDQLDRVVDSVFELLNAGFIKIIGDIGDDTGHVAIEPRLPPEPPHQPITRARRN